MKSYLLLTLKSINPSVQFSVEYSKDQIPFLDILIKRNRNGVWMDLQHNPQTHKDVYLLSTSSHSSHCKENIPFCVAQRICTIAEHNTKKLRNLENLKSHLSKYQYPDSLIKQEFQKALSIPQKDLRKPKKPSNENILPLIATFNPNNPNIYSTIKSSVHCSKNNISCFQNINLIRSKRQPPNLKKL